MTVITELAPLFDAFYEHKNPPRKLHMNAVTYAEFRDVAGRNLAHPEEVYDRKFLGADIEIDPREPKWRFE